MAASAKEKFEAAVNVIQSLPKNGSFQPSIAMMLTFYGLYKQATNGQCNVGKPGFWNVVGKAKWDAWNSLGSMSKETAMTRYVDELKKIIETMPHTDNVQEFVERLGDFYEVVDDDTPIGQMVRNASPKHRSTSPVRSISPDLIEVSGKGEPISKPNGFDQENGQDLTRYSSSSSTESSPQRVSPSGNVDGPHSFHSISVAQRALGSGEPTSDSGSDAEEFCDTSDISNLQDENVLRQSPLASTCNPEGRLSSNSVLANEALVASEASSSLAQSGKHRSNGHNTSGHSQPVDLVSGRNRGEGYQLTTGVTTGSTDQLAVALERLQQDMSSALVRLQAMETLFMAQKEALEKTRLSYRKPNKWRLFAGVNYPTVAFLIAWPLVIHLVVRYMTRKRN